MDVAKYIGELENIVKKGGPDRDEYKKLKNIAVSLRNIPLEDEAKLYEIFKPILDTNSIIGHTFLKPYGYAGDYELIDKIHTKKVSDDPFLEKWDYYYLAADSSTAFRNRKKYFIRKIKKAKQDKKEVQILNLGSGPCRDVNEFYLKNNGSGIFIDCLDMDSSAIEYAKGVCDNFLDNISFINKNVFRFKTSKQYDLIWSAGLFDYFSDKLFIRLTNRMYQMLEKGGELVIGNFSTKNPGREEMEVYGKWYLNHRNEQTLIDLALKAGIDEKNISVNCEKTGVNLFLHIKN